jgi:tRNA dimethylallyltransferase
MIYRDMNIGSGKPPPAEQLRYPHHLIDVVDPAESFSAARFCDMALNEIATAHQLGQLPILVGGTMLYFKALFQGLAALPDANPALRTQLELRVEREGLAALHAELARIDPAAGQRIHPNDPQRILRALEVYHLSGKPISDFFADTRTAFDYPLTQIAVLPETRQHLHQAIADRFDAMLQAGLEAEVQRLRARGDLHRDLPSIRCVGYRQMWDYLDGKCDWNAMRDQAISATRGLAKRQFTWLREWSVALRVPDGREESFSHVLKRLNTIPI